MPTIVFLIRSLDRGGAERQLVALATGLHRLGWKVQVLVSYAGGGLEPQLRESGVNVVDLKKGGRRKTVGFIWRMLTAIRRAQPDIVHGYLDVPNILLALFRPMFPAARVVWGVRASDIDLAHYDALWRILFHASVVASRFADLIICNSEAGRAYHAAHGYPDARMVVVPNGVDLRQFRPDESARRQLRAEWDIGAQEKLVGLVGRLHPMKDHPNFLDAAARIAAIRTDVKFVCVGDGEASYRDQMMNTAELLGLGKHLVWAGAREDMWRVYNALDLAVSSSAFGEGMSNSLAEAMATGVPCVATENGDAKSLVGAAGWVCPPRDSEALCGTIMEALGALPVDGEAIRQRMAREFSSEALVSRTAELLRGLVPVKQYRRPVISRER